MPARGTTLKFTALFKNAAGESFVPLGANLQLRYKKLGVVQQKVWSMDLDGSAFVYTLDTSDFDRGVLLWQVRSTGPEAAVDMGVIQLLGNAADF